MDRIGFLAVFRILFPIEKLPVLLRLGMGVPTFYILHFLQAGYGQR